MLYFEFENELKFYNIGAWSHYLLHFASACYVGWTMFLCVFSCVIFLYVSVIVACHCDIHWIDKVLSYQPRVTVTSCFVFKVIRDL